MTTLIGSNGTFVTAVTTGTTTGTPSTLPGAVGVHKNKDRIKIDYTPSAGGTCKDIRLVQTVSWVAYDASGAVDGNRPEDIYLPGKNKYAHRNDDEVTVGTNVWAVDHIKCEGDPFYNGNDPKDTSSSADATATPIGTTTMSDGPNSEIWHPNYRASVDSIIKTFEVCAICVTCGSRKFMQPWAGSSDGAREQPGIR